MKIAIQGHLSRGKEVIQILKSLGGKSREELTGRLFSQYYFINCNGDIDLNLRINLPNRKLYTLEEFEKEFPFKVGDKVIDYEGDVATITGFAYIEENLGYSLQYENERGTATPRILTPYKGMKEKRNITLTLDKAKEWYKKGGELREIALQAFSETELNPLPKSWEEYCRKYGYGCLSTRYTNISLKHDVLIKLEQLRNCWRQGWKPEWDFDAKYAIKNSEDELCIILIYKTAEFLAFPTREMAKEFLECFRDLIEQAGDLI